LDQVLRYHRRTKHSFTDYARGPRGLDWANQPDPFRRYSPAPLVHLLHPSAADGDGDCCYPTPSYSSLFDSLPAPKPISRSTISELFHNSLALSAWKTSGFSTWSLRVNPSSGNLHPTEAYIVSPAVDGLSEHAFVAHYAPEEHALEVRARIPTDFFPECFPDGSFLVGFSSIFWREAWKYGERAFRYCNHDVGHAIASVSMAAAALGWTVRILDGLGHEDLGKLMGLQPPVRSFSMPTKPVKGKMPEIEFEHPDCALLVFPGDSGDFEVDYDRLRSKFSHLDWIGKANALSEEHICWDIIYRTAEAVQKPPTTSKKESIIINDNPPSNAIDDPSSLGLTLSQVARKRRSAVDMDGSTSISRETFYRIMLHCLPSNKFGALTWACNLHAVVFVHRVAGLPAGLYFLVRNAAHFPELKSSMRSDFKWAVPDGCPDDLPLFELSRGDCRDLSKRLSCHQDIAGDGCFSLGMVARFEPTLRDVGAWMYPRLFWESGVLGQILYLEAHEVGVSATGIGCFFDDPVHEVMGVKGWAYQSLYHFTVGGAVVDTRITSLPAYP
ncbi:hypothetical protein M569_09571, partial [Genlisea aurea]